MAITFGVNLSVDNYWDVPELVWRAEVLDSPAAIPIPSKYPTRVWFLGGGGFTPEKHGPEKVRGQSVDITAKGPDHSDEVWAFSCLESWCRERDSNPHTRKGSGF